MKQTDSTYDSALDENAQDGKKLLVLDTDAGVRWALEHGLRHSGYDVYAASTVGEALQLCLEGGVSCVVMELLPEAGLTLETLDELLDTLSAPKIICVSVEAAPHTVIECMRRGAADFVPKPFSLADIRTAIARAFGDGGQWRTPRRNANRAGGKGKSDSHLIGISPAMKDLQVTVEQVARTDLNCLVRGESGTGKDMVARELHRLSARHDKPFVKVNCTALPEQLLESELFGYEKGAFTGANTAKPGRFQLANKGIIFLDEIGDIPTSLQAKLLQVIEHKEFTSLGGTKSIKVDVQIVAATNADLEANTKDGTFRHDLYFRLNEISIWVPPLRHRKEDVPLLVRHFVQKHSRFMGNTDAQLTGEELAGLTEYDWPGNVRELESTIKRWLALGRRALPGVHAEAAQASGNGAHANPAPNPATEADERTRILRALEEHQWNRRKAAEMLGMSYQTLRRRIDKYQLDQR